MRGLRRRVEIGLLTAIAIRGRPVKGLSLADHALCLTRRIKPSLSDVPPRRFR